MRTLVDAAAMAGSPSGRTPALSDNGTSGAFFGSDPVGDWELRFEDTPQSRSWFAWLALRETCVGSPSYQTGQRRPLYAGRRRLPP